MSNLICPFFCCSRKQKLTPHWKAYIQPYTWRYKWVELQIRRLRSQARKYDLQLAKINQRKQQRLADLKVEEFGSKSVIFPIHAQRKKVMKRNIRKPVEGTIDKAAYMANHNLFSSFGMSFSIVRSRLCNYSMNHRLNKEKEKKNGN